MIFGYLNLRSLIVNRKADKILKEIIDIYLGLNNI
jgi:hypothetical protein